MSSALETAKPAATIYWTVAALVVVYAVAAFIVAPTMYPDSAWGFVVSDAMMRGGPFNHLVEPAQADLTRDSSTFSTLWSPGQYMLPHALEVLGMPLGPALVVVTTVFTVMGLVGW